MNGDVAEIREYQKRRLADLLEEIAYEAVGVMKAQLPSASALQAATVCGIAVDKMRLLREEPTAIHRDQSPVTIEEKRQYLLGILDSVNAE